MNRRTWWIIGALFVLCSGLFGRYKMTRKEFIAKFNAAADRANLQGFVRFLLLVLASYESGDGRGKMALATNNIFSLQAPASWKGATWLQTSTGNRFRVYPDYTAAINDFVNLLVNWPSNYGPATAAARRGDLAGFARALQAGGYGDPGKTTYAQELYNRGQEFAA